MLLNFKFFICIAAKINSMLKIYGTVSVSPRLAKSIKRHQQLCQKNKTLVIRFYAVLKLLELGKDFWWRNSAQISMILWFVCVEINTSPTLLRAKIFVTGNIDVETESAYRREKYAMDILIAWICRTKWTVRLVRYTCSVVNLILLIHTIVVASNYSKLEVILISKTSLIANVFCFH